VGPLELLAIGLEHRVATAPSKAKADRARQLLTHVREFVLPRATDLNAPLVVVVLGSTGAGKSSLFNSVAGSPISESGLLRPTTRQPVALVHPDDDGTFGLKEVRRVASSDIPRGLVLIDAPDFDSVEIANRKLALDLLEAADLVVFVTTVTRYADFVPWAVLARARERGVPMLAVINRMPSDPEEAERVISDYRRLLIEGDIGRLGAFGDLEVVTVPEGALDRSIDGLAREAIRPIDDAITHLREDQEARRAVARRAVASAVESLPRSVESIALEVEAEQAAGAALIEIANNNYQKAQRELEGEIEAGTFLRSEVLRQWLDFVRAGPTARFLSEGIGRIASTIRSLFRPPSSTPAPDVQDVAFSDLLASALRRSDDAARRTAQSWTDDELGAVAVAAKPELWGSRPEFASELDDGLARWVEGIAEEITVVGAQRKGWAQAATIGLNVLGTSVMLAVFVHTGGLTGAEVGIGAATAVVNQKLLEAVFGEANVAAFVKRARDRLYEVLRTSFELEKDRFISALGPQGQATDLASDLRRLSREAKASIA
jgi:energy-coupling factor transporter ATP-binding protein EcfA2